MKCEVKKTFPEITLTIKQFLFKSTVMLVSNSNLKVNLPSLHHTHKENGCSGATLSHFLILFCWPLLNHFQNGCFSVLSHKYYMLFKNLFGTIFVEDGKNSIWYIALHKQTTSCMFTRLPTKWRRQWMMLLDAQY